MIAPAPSAGAATKPAVNAPKDPPLGNYSVYQMTGPTFSYKYRFSLDDRGHYTYIGKQRGTYSYNAKTKTVSFKTGRLKGFVGLYYTDGRNANGPTIALNPKGVVPKLESAFLSQYQYAYYRPAAAK